jgi:hypothetical protein
MASTLACRIVSIHRLIIVSSFFIIIVAMIRCGIASIALGVTVVIIVCFKLVGCGFERKEDRKLY